VGVWRRVGNTRLLKHENIKLLSSLTCRLLLYIYIYEITPVFFGDRLLLQVVVLVDTTNFWSYEDTSCAEFCGNGVILLYKSMVF